MLRFDAFLLFCFISVSAAGQNIQIVAKYKNGIPYADNKHFDYIAKYLEVQETSKIATLICHYTFSGKQTLTQLFSSLSDTANKLGANSYRIETCINNLPDTIYIELSIYDLTSLELNKNLNLFPLNMIYIFGDLNSKRPDEKTFRLNDQKITLLPFEYVSFQNRAGEEATISFGGFLGSKIWVKGQEGKLPKYYSLGGIGVGPGAAGEFGISLNTGRIGTVDLNFGQFLVRILNEKK
jgi:hypothetical protein